MAQDLKFVDRAATSEEEASQEMGCLCRAMESEIRADRRPVATELGLGDSFLCISSRDPQGDLYDQCGRIVEHVPAQSAEDESSLPQ